MIKNKRGWVAVVECCLAIVVLFTFLMLAFSNPLEKKAKDYSGIAREVLFQVENNEGIRGNILGSNGDIVETSLRDSIKKIDSSVNLSVCIADMDESCSSNSVPAKKEVSVYDFFVFDNRGLASSTSSKRLKVFLWGE